MLRAAKQERKMSDLYLQVQVDLKHIDLISGPCVAFPAGLLTHDMTILEIQAQHDSCRRQGCEKVKAESIKRCLHGRN